MQIICGGAATIPLWILGTSQPVEELLKGAEMLGSNVRVTRLFTITARRLTTRMLVGWCINI